jgi:hypothetical protein
MFSILKAIIASRHHLKSGCNVPMKNLVSQDACCVSDFGKTSQELPSACKMELPCQFPIGAVTAKVSSEMKASSSPLNSSQPELHRSGMTPPW